MKEIYSTPNMIVIALDTKDVVRTSQVTSVDTVKWEDVKKEQWGNQNPW